MGRKSHSQPRYFVGMNKIGHHAGACVLTGQRDFELVIKERLTRVKADGGTIEGALSELLSRFDPANAAYAENSYLKRSAEYEDELAGRYPYYERLKSLGLEQSSQRFNAALEHVPHHRCHAYSALLVSPFEKSLIVVFDGIGSAYEAFDSSDPERALGQGGPGLSEACTVYTQDGVTLAAVHKEWQAIDSEITAEVVGSNFGLGAMYSIAARYIFGSFHESGKVMGLAPYGKPSLIPDRTRYLKELPWKDSFAGRGKKDWERSGRFERYAAIAASVQKHFEDELGRLLERLKRAHPGYENLILTGGCALNCVANAKVAASGLWKNVYVTPFPGDESVAVGAAAFSAIARHGLAWTPVEGREQRCNFGPASSAAELSLESLKRAFPRHKIEKPASIAVACAELLSRGAILGWFQGRSESGPRALGFRSLLANPLVSGIRDRLNSEVKKREAFRPYAPSVPWERAAEFFEIPDGFESPFMSFSPLVRAAFRQKLAEVSHVDGTARLQTVRREHNPSFYELLERFGKTSGVPCLLNTSLNVMGEPIVERVADAARLFESAPLDALAVGDLLVIR